MSNYDDIIKELSNIKNQTQKLNLYVIRLIDKKIIDEICSTILEWKYDIKYKLLITIKNKEDFFEKFYENYTEYSDDILKHNSKQCLAIITNSIPDKNILLKKMIRIKYKDLGVSENIIHCSDTS